MRMIKRTALAAAVLMAVAIGSAGAAEMVGWNKCVVQPNSDVLVTLPFTQETAGTYTVTGVVSGTGVQVAGPLTTDQYKNVYYIRFTSGAAIGRWSTITGNSTSQMALQDTTFLGDVVSGDTFNVYPHHTLATVFPNSMQGISFLTTPALTRNTEVIIPTTTGAAVNRSAAATYYHKSGEWKKVGGSSSDNVVLSPQEYFIIRNNDAVKTITFVTSGNVEASTLVRNVPREAAKNDVIACSGRPTRITLGELNLGGTAAFATTTGLTRVDELLVFDNSTGGKNKSASATYFWKKGASDPVGHWQKVGGSGSYDNQPIAAGAALVIRKAASAGAPVAWTEYSPY